MTLYYIHNARYTKCILRSNDTYKSSFNSIYNQNSVRRILCVCLYAWDYIDIEYRMHMYNLTVSQYPFIDYSFITQICEIFYSRICSICYHQLELFYFMELLSFPLHFIMIFFFHCTFNLCSNNNRIAFNEIFVMHLVS